MLGIVTVSVCFVQLVPMVTVVSVISTEEDGEPPEPNPCINLGPIVIEAFALA